MADSAPTRLFVSVGADPDDRELLAAVAEAHGVTVEPVRLRDLGVVTGVVLVGGFAVLVAAVRGWVERREDLQHGGQVIDLIDGDLRFRRDPHLLPDLLVVRTADGVVHIKSVNRPDRLKDVVQAVLSTLRPDGGAPTAAEIAEAARSTGTDLEIGTSDPDDSGDPE